MPTLLNHEVSTEILEEITELKDAVAILKRDSDSPHMNFLTGGRIGFMVIPEDIWAQTKNELVDKLNRRIGEMQEEFEAL